MSNNKDNLNKRSRSLFISSTSASTKRQKYENEKIQIMYAAAKFMAKKRYLPVTLDDVAESIGSTKGKLYYYFKSKGDLLYQMQMYAFDMVENALSDVINNEVITPRKRVEMLIRTYLCVMCDNWEVFRALWDIMTWRELPAPLLKSLNRRGRQWEHKIESVIEELIQVEGWKGIDTKLTARTVFATANSVSRWYKRNGYLSAAEVTESIVKLIMEGFFPKSREL